MTQKSFAPFAIAVAISARPAIFCALVLPSNKISLSCLLQFNKKCIKFILKLVKIFQEPFFDKPKSQLDQILRLSSNMIKSLNWPSQS